jgi:hypothetical protein
MVTRFGMHEKLALVTYRRHGRLSSARTRLAHFAEWEFNLARRLPPMRLRDRFRVGHPYAKASMHFQSEHAHFGPFSRSSGQDTRGAPAVEPTRPQYVAPGL